jgi:hypothetical protein
LAVTARLLVAADPADQDARRDEVRQLIDRYFQTWSAQDIQRYGQCFVPQAAVQVIDQDGKLVSMPLAPFLRSQQEAHRRAATPMVETAESIEIRFDAKLAHALVSWKLVDGNRIETGYDHFTLMRSGGQWRIANLIFYSTAEEKAP